MALIIRLILQTIRRDPTGSVWIDEASNLSRPDSSGVDQIDAEHQTKDLAVGVRPRGVDADRLWPGRHSHQHPWTVGGCMAALPGPARPTMICMRASDLPAAAPHTASQHPISLSSIRPATCSSIERSEVPRCPPNGPTIDGKDGVAGSIPARGSTDSLARKRRSPVISGGGVTPYRFGRGQSVDSPVRSGSTALTSLVAGSGPSSV
jgi:hypothetical protein